MATIWVLPLEGRVETRPGETLLEALRRAGADMESPCGGRRQCGKCVVRVEPAGAVPETPHRDLSPSALAEGYRLACGVRPESDLTVHLSGNFSLDARVLEGDLLEAASLSPAAVVEGSDGRWRLRYRDAEDAELTEWEEGWSAKGLSLDVGTTTLVATLLCLRTGRELATTSGLNPQTRYGHDVLSRIQMGGTPEGLATLSGAVRKGLNELVAEACAEAGTDPREIVDAVVGGNTTMVQLLAAIDPKPLGLAPFIVSIEGARSYPAGQFGLAVNLAARVYVPPLAHAYIGSDISAGLLASGFFERAGPVLFIDIGTNGELGLHANGRWLVTSAAAGPAFEGMGISAGMRAAPGAVERVRYVEEGFEADTIGGGAARGICGSGILDLIAALRRSGAVDRTGRLAHGRSAAVPEHVAERLVEAGGKPAFRVADGVCFTQEDVRQVQLAKGAIRTAIDLLLEEAETAASALRTVVLAGGFGYHLRPDSLEAIGLLPPGLGDRVVFAGNTSRTGCALLLVDGESRLELVERMGRVRHLGLAERRTFQDRFIRNLGFP